MGVYNIQNPYRTQAAIYGDLREAAAEAKRVGITAFGDLHDQLRCVLHAVAAASIASSAKCKSGAGSDLQ